MNKKKLIKFFSLFFCAILLIGINVVLSIGLTSCVKKSNNKTNITLVNTCTITFDANGGTGTMSALTVDEGETTTLPASTFTRTNYKFIGWATSATSTEVVYTDRQSLTIFSSFKLYALWELGDATVTYTSDGASGGFTETVSTGSYTLPGYEYISDRFTPNVSYGYIAGYQVDGSNYNFNDSITITKDTEINVVISTTYTIRAFKEISGNGSYSSIDYFDVSVTIESTTENVTFPTQAEAIENGVVVPSGYRLKGWNYTSASGDVAFESVPVNTIVMLSNSGMIYIRPVFEVEEYTLTIKREATDNTCSGDDIEIIVDNNGYILKDPLSLSFEIETLGYYFVEYVDANDPSKVYKAGDTIELEDDLTLYVRTSNVYYFNFCCHKCNLYVTKEVTYNSEFDFSESASYPFELGAHKDENGVTHNNSYEYGTAFKYWTTHELYNDINDYITYDTVITVTDNWILDKDTKSTTFYPVISGGRTKFIYHSTNGDVSKQVNVDTGDIYSIAWSEEVENEAFDSYNSRLAGWSFTPNSLEPDYLVSEKIFVKYEMDGEIDLYPVFKTALIGVVKSSNTSTNLVVIENARYPITVDMELTFIDPDTGNSYSTTVEKIEVNGASTSYSNIGDTVYLTLTTTFSGSITDYFLATLKGDGVAVNKVTKAKVTFVDPSYEEYFSNSSVYCFSLNGCDCTKKEFYSFEIKETTKTEDELYISFDIKQQLVVSYYDEIYIYCEEVDDGPFAIITEIECEYPSIIIF